MEAGRQAADIAAKFGEKHATGADFLKKHAKAAKCAFSDLILDSYPASPVKVAEKPVEKPAAKMASFDPTVDEILAWDRSLGGRSAASFLASDEEADDDLLMDGDEVVAGRLWNGDKSTPDDSLPYKKRNLKVPAGENGSEQRGRYNKEYRKEVCVKDHKTNCGLTPGQVEYIKSQE